MAEELDLIRAHLGQQRLSEAVRAALGWFSGGEPMALAGSLGGALRPLIDAGQSQTVSAFLTQLRSFVDGPVIEEIRRGLDEARAEAGDWGAKLRPVTQERLGRECRDALRLRAFGLALERAQAILSLQVGDQPLAFRCRYLGGVLGSLENIQPDVDILWSQVQRQWSSWGLPPDLLATVEAARRERLQSIYQRRYDMGEMEWVRELTALAVALKADLPRPDQLGAATEEEIDRFHAALLGLAKAGLASPQRISLPDALWVMVEYTPREQTRTAERAGIEQRVHATLGPRAQQVASEAFRRLGALAPLREAILDVTLRPPFDRYRDLGLELMAALEWPGFAECALGILEDKRKVAHHPAAIAAVGACGGERALDNLCEILREACRGRVVEGHDRRLAEKTLNAMSRVIRRHDITGPARDALVEKVVKLVPERDTRLRLYVASRLCLHRPQDLAPRHLEWTVRRFLEGIWRPDQTPTFARPTDVEEIRKRPLGQRQGFVNALVAMGTPALPVIHDFVMSEASRVSGATIAVAEVLGKIAHPSSVGPLEALLRSVLLTSEEALHGAYVEEQVFDPEAGRMVPLSQDILVAAVLDALRRIGTPEAIDVLWRLRQQIELRQVPNFGKMTAAILTKLPPRPGARAPAPVAAEPSERIVPSCESVFPGSTPAASLPSPQPGPSTSELLADLSGGGFLGLGAARARPRRIAALQMLSQRLAPEAVEPIMALLTDRDAMVRASAKTALSAYVAPGAPAEVQAHFADLALRVLGDSRSKIRDSLLEFLSGINTTTEPWASRIDALMKTEPTGALRAGLARLRRSAGSVHQTAPQRSPLLSASEPAGREAPRSPAEAPRGVDLLMLKRQYLDARRAWIAGGKKGPPPEPPPGLSLE